MPKPKPQARFELVRGLFDAMLMPVSRIEIYNPLRAAEVEVLCDFHVHARAVEGRMTRSGDVFHICAVCKHRLSPDEPDLRSKTLAHPRALIRRGERIRNNNGVESIAA